ncbi:MAG: carboxypeptidase-like regulatory domain-containing protein, partial [Candidatus Sumerlaeaceae bacterium]|nr:carboxypeptidase-like regulatory domain-containing protein [Candidatus Sumerlaeaceae bacterium]
VTSSAHLLRLRSEKSGVIWCTDNATWATPYRYLGAAAPRYQSLRVRLLAAASIAGHVRREDSLVQTTTTSYLVRLYAKTPSPDERPMMLEAITDEKGAFRFPCVPAGAYRVVATQPRGNVEKVAELEVQPGHEHRLDFLLPAGKLFAGRVRDSKDQPLGGVAVRYYVRAADGSTKGGMIETNADGHFRVEELDGEALSFVQVERKGYVPWQKRDIPLPCDSLEIVLVPEAALPFVVKGSPAELWQVYLMRLDVWGSGTYANQLVGREIASTRVVGGSQDAFPSPATGRYRIVACDSKGEQVGVSPEIEWDPTKGIGSPVVITPGKTGRLRVEFESAHVENGELVATNMILPESIASAERRLPDIVGDSAELDNLIPGDYLITVTSSSFNSSATNVRVEPDRSATVKLKALQLGTIEGRIMNAKTPVPGIQVTIKSQTDPSFEPRTATTDAAGLFRVDGLAPDLYVVELMWQGEGGIAKSLRRSAKVSGDGGVARVEINIAPPPRLSFALPHSFNVAPGAPVVLLSRDSGETIRPEWKADVLEAELEPGVYTVSVGDAPVGTMRLHADGRTEALE